MDTSEDHEVNLAGLNLLQMLDAETADSVHSSEANSADIEALLGGPEVASCGEWMKNRQN